MLLLLLFSAVECISFRQLLYTHILPNTMRCDHTNFSTHFAILCTPERRNLLNMKSVCSSYQNTLQIHTHAITKAAAILNPKPCYTKIPLPDTSPSSSFIIHNSIHQKIIITLKKDEKIYSMSLHRVDFSDASLHFMFYVCFEFVTVSLSVFITIRPPISYD